MREKTFEYKGQAMKYYNKVEANLKVKFVWCGWSHEYKAWTVRWAYN